MPIRLTLRMQFGPHQDAARVTEQLERVFAESGADELMVFAYAEELNDGHETIERVREWLAHSRAYRERLAARGVEISLNPWHTLLHTDRGRRLKPSQRWQTMVDPRGRQATACVCPLDPGWRAYIDEVFRLFAAERFRVVWLDDDIRLHNHAPLHWGGCFCPLHLAAFSRAIGQQVSREQLVAACLAPGEPHPWRAKWMDTWESTHLAMIAAWRGILAGAGTKLGLMSSDLDQHAAEGRRWRDWWRALAGDQPPVHRPHFWGYGDWMGHELPAALVRLDQNRCAQDAAPGGRAAIESGPEIERFPYGRWMNSYRQLGAHCLAALVSGSRTLNISLHDFMGNDPGDEPERAPWLRAMRPAFERVAELFPPTLRTVGVGLPTSEDAGRRARTAAPGDDWSRLVVPSRAWAQWLGGIGWPCSASTQPVNAIAGAMAWAFTDAELERLLAGGLLVDGTAAEILVARGHGAAIGARSTRRIAQDDLAFSIEHCTDAAFALREDAQISLNYGGPHCATLLQAELDPRARVVSDVRDARQTVLGHGQWLFENDRGGRVAVVPWSAQWTGWHALPISAQRAAQLSRTLDWLDRDGAIVRVGGGPWLVPQVWTDGTKQRIAVWNASPDDAAEISARAGFAKALRRALHIDAAGALREAEVRGETIRPTAPLRQWELLLLW